MLSNICKKYPCAKCEMSDLKTTLLILWIIGLCGPCLSVQLSTAHLSGNMDRCSEEPCLACSYSRETLLELQPKLTREMTSSHVCRLMLDNILQGLIKTNRRKKRGRREGFRNRLRRRLIGHPFRLLFFKPATKWMRYGHPQGTVTNFARHHCYASRKAGYNLQCLTLSLKSLDSPLCEQTGTQTRGKLGEAIFACT